MIMVGAGAIDAVADLRAIAERLVRQSSATFKGEDTGLRHTRCRSVAPGPFEWRDADVILAVGTRFNTPRRRWGLRPAQRVVADRFRSGSVSPRRAPNVAVLADARVALAALVAGLGAKVRKRRQSTVDRQAQGRGRGGV